MNIKLLIIGSVCAIFAIVTGAAAAFVMISNHRSSIETRTIIMDANENKEQEKKKFNGWKEEKGNWYFYKDNEKQKNWVQDKDSWYYLGSDGKMRTGWIQDNNEWYYMNEDGTMATNMTVDGCYIGNDGTIEDTPSHTKNTQTLEKVSDDSSPKLTVDDARNKIIEEIDAKDWECMGTLSYLYEVTSAGDDFGANNIREYVGNNENLYKYQSAYTNNFFYVGIDSGTIYYFDAGGTIGHGLYKISNGVRTDTWRIGGYKSDGVIHSTNGEDWVELS